MKKVYLLVIIMLPALSTTLNAQLNYLFSATTRSYVPVTNGIVPHLTNSGTHEAADEGGATIPIGFTFKYNGENYSNANVNANGYITLGNAPDGYYLYYINSIKTGPFGTLYSRPLIAPLWDDLYIGDTANLVYKTTGAAPFRVFTIEWKKAKWSYDALAPALSIELKLYETTGIIEFHYRDEGGVPDIFAYASIGITSSDRYRDFISLQNTSSHPTISLLGAMDSIHTKPADNQVYRFVPALLKPPVNFRRSYSYTNKTISLKMQSGEANSFEYAVIPSAIAPSSGTTFSSKVTISSLLPATTYYVYVRSKAFNFLHSQWVCDSFTTQVKPLSPPYMLNTTQPDPKTNLPEDVRTQDFQDTVVYNDLQFEWYGGADFPNAGDNFIYYTKVPGYFDNDTWLFTRGLHLTGGKTYSLKFSYLAFYYYNAGELGSLEVKYGTGAGFRGMNSGVLFKKSDINSNDPQADTTIEFTPGHTDVYYFGFHDFTPANEGSPIVINVSVDENSSIPVALNGKTTNTGNSLTFNEQANISNLEVQRSADGINFTKIGSVNLESKNTYNDRSNHDIFKIHNTISNLFVDQTINSTKPGEKNASVNKEPSGSKAWIERIHGGKDTYSNTESVNAKNNLYNNNTYIDNNVQQTYYYRLRKVDNDGRSTYSNIVVLNKEDINKNNFAAIYPNPVDNILNVKIVSASTKSIKVLITDISGKLLQQKTTQVGKGETIVQFNVSGLTAGTYFLKVDGGTGEQNVIKKFIKE